MSSRNKYKDLEYVTDAPEGSIGQLKYDGNWCQLSTDDEGRTHFFSRTNREYRVEKLGLPKCSIILAEHLIGTQWACGRSDKGSLKLFDLYQTQVPYVERHKALNNIVAESGRYPLLDVVGYEPLTRFGLLRKAAKDSNFEGYVFRDPNGMFGDKLYRFKYERSLEGKVIAAEVGKGKYRGMIGALVVELPTGSITSVGSGLTDEDRARPLDYFMGKTIEIAGKGLTNSGCLRHPVYRGIRADKPQT
jgi:ATP-dependent DNA ligase